MSSKFTDLDYYFHHLGGNIIPCSYKDKKSIGSWKHLQTNSLSLEEYEKLKQNNPVSNWGLITGKRLRGPYKEKYLVVIDLDNKKAIDEFLSYFDDKVTIETIAQKTIVVQHQDTLGERAHIYFITERPVVKRSGIHGLRKKEEIPSIEVKSDTSTYVICPPSVSINGYSYEIVGTKDILVLNETATKNLEDFIDHIYKKYGSKNCLPGQTNIPINELFKPEFVVYEGNNRHLNLLRIMESFIQRFDGLLTEEEVKIYAQDQNQKHCSPPLDEKQFEKQWEDAKKFILSSGSRNSNLNSKDKTHFKGDIIQTTISDSNGPSQEEILVDLIESRCRDIFLDQFHEIFVSVQINDHIETLPIDGSRFEKLIIKECYDGNIRQITKEKIKNIVDIIKTKKEFGTDVIQKTLNLRVASEGDNYYYDLTNQKWEVIRVTSEGWTILPNSKPIFRRYQNNSAQVYPNKEYSSNCFEKFFELLNIPGKKERLLLTAYIVSLLIPDIPKPILVIHGGKGAAKTTTFELIKKIVDPGIVDTLSFPKEANELIQALSHSHVSYFDNISRIPDLLSDLLCRVVTGSGFTKRKLYSDDDDISYNFRRCIGINGINLASVKPDFLDRSIIIEVNPINKKKRRKEQDIKSEFNEMLPDILGWIFDLIVKILKYRKENSDEIKLSEYPRMADFAEFGEIISRCSGHRAGEFMEAYFENIDIQNDEVIESSIIAKTILHFMEDKVKWEGTISLLLNLLTDSLGDENERLKKSKSWVNAPNVLSRRIKELEPTLKEKGIEITRSYDNKKKSRILTITNMAKLSSLPLYQNNFSNATEIANENNETALS